MNDDEVDRVARRLLGQFEMYMELYGALVEPVRQYSARDKLRVLKRLAELKLEEK